jgi:NTE family protein
MFNPIVLKNHTGCGDQALLDLDSEKEEKNYVTQATVDGLKSYANKEEREYIHLVDGGITDNLGLLALYDIVNVSDERYVNKIHSSLKPHLIAISIDASTTPDSSMDSSPKEPGLAETINFMTDVQVHRLNEVAKTLFRYDMHNLEETGEVATYFIDINLSNIDDPERKRYLNNIPTDLELEPEQVNALIEEGVRQVRENPELARFLRNTNHI